jgi:hypothetical protein
MRCPPTHPVSSGVRLSGRPVSSQSGVRSPGVVVRVRRSGRLLSTRPALRCSTVRCPTVRCSTVCCPPVGPDASGSSHLRWRWDQVGAGQPSPQERAEVPVGRRAAERLGRRPSRPERRRRRRGRALVSGGRWRDLGRVGGGRSRRRVPAERLGRPGRRAERRWLAAARGTGAGCSARWPHLPRGCRPGLGGRPRCVVAAEPHDRVGGPGGASGRAGGSRRAAPPRPRLAASAPGSLPAAP